jgi:uncharacterized protein
MRSFRLTILVTAALVLCGVAAPPPPALSPLSFPPKPATYVTDNAGVLPPARAAVLNDALAAFGRKTSDQIYVYVDHRVPPGTTLEALGANALKAWRIGRKGRDNGAVLFVFVDDKKMRIAVAPGLHEAISDETAQHILGDVVRPHFIKGDFAGGVEAGAQAIMATAVLRPAPPTETATRPAVIGIAAFLLCAALLAAVVVVSQRRAKPAPSPPSGEGGAGH